MPGVALETLLELYGGHAATTGELCGWTGCSVARHGEFYWASAKLTGDVGFHCGSRFGAQWLSGSQPVYLWSYEHEAENAIMKVRKPPSWPRSWANRSLL
jgi:hypothetical protein